MAPFLNLCTPHTGWTTCTWVFFQHAIQALRSLFHFQEILVCGEGPCGFFGAHPQKIHDIYKAIIISMSHAFRLPMQRRKIIFLKFKSIRYTTVSLLVGDPQQSGICSCDLCKLCNFRSMWGRYSKVFQVKSAKFNENKRLCKQGTIKSSLLLSVFLHVTKTKLK